MPASRLALLCRLNLAGVHHRFIQFSRFVMISVPCCHVYLAGTTGYRTFPLIDDPLLDGSVRMSTICQQTKTLELFSGYLSFFWLKLSRLSSPFTGRVEILSTSKKKGLLPYHIVNHLIEKR